MDGRERWEPRECGELSKALGANFGLPIDISSKMGGVRAIANALNDGDVARAQIATVLLGIPDLPVLSEGENNAADLIKCIRDLHMSRLLKADWDADEHPRWPAGAPDGQGGQFAPKDEDASTSQSSAGTTEQSRSPSKLDAEISAYRQGYDFAAPSNIQSALRTDNEDASSDDSGRPSANDTEDRGTYSSYDSHIGDVQVASTGAIALDGPIDFANPASWKNLLRLPDGALKLGTGEIVTAAALLSAWDMQREKAAVDAAFAKFGLDPTNAADVLAIRAYVWAQTAAPWTRFGPLVNFGVPSSGPQLESVSQFIMALELARPGTLGLAQQGDAQSNAYLNLAAAGWHAGRRHIRKPASACEPARRRSRPHLGERVPQLNLQTNDQMQAHHLIPANVWGAYVHITMLAGQAGWLPDTPDNLIPLPANAATQAKLAAGGLTLPIHSSSHPNYDLWTSGEIIMEQENYGNTLTPIEARAIFEKVEIYMRRLIVARMWMPRLY